jgi:hypothetical protein
VNAVAVYAGDALGLGLDGCEGATDGGWTPAVSVTIGPSTM